VPELPDLQYIVKKLGPRILGRRIMEVTVREPIVIRMLLPEAGGFVHALPGRTFDGLARRGPFLVFTLSDGIECIVHCMLAGRLQIAPAEEKAVPRVCFALRLEGGAGGTGGAARPVEWLRYADEKKMGKVYLTSAGSWDLIPGLREQGVDILSEEFTFERFDGLIEGRRHQARVFLMDQAALSAIGNAYADEILFAAGIHPKTACSSLSSAQRRKLYDSIGSVMRWGIEEVEKAAQPIEVKVREHVRVRNRKDEPCPVCGSTIRRVGVLGYDSFYCPECQPATRRQAISWQGRKD
jgi:formamidopyrimidine-DNA glycosylase